jgi:hypothetical protein
MGDRKRSIGEFESRILRFLVDVGEEALPRIANNLGERTSAEQRAAILQRMVDALDTLAQQGLIHVFARGSNQTEGPVDLALPDVRAAVQEEVADLPWIE